jgi:hypothetical protein
MPDEIADLKARLAAAEAARDHLAMTPALDAAIAASGVLPQFRAAVRALFLDRKGLELDGREVLLGGAPIESALKAWAATPEGRAFTTAPADARPLKGSKGAPTRKRSEMTKAERAAYVREYGLEAFEALPR